MKQRATLAVLAVTLLAFSACGHRDTARPGQLTLGMVTDVGGLGDRSFNDSANAGLMRAKTQLDAYTQVLQSRSAADYQPNLNALSNQKFQMIYAIGFLMSKDLDTVAKQNPSTHYTIIDAVVDEPNVVSVTFNEQDGSFLAGALAAMVSKTHHVAFLGGLDIPLLRKFEAGFTAGVHEIDPTAKVDVKYVGSFDDVAAGKEFANVLYNSGADIIYAAAGKAGLGAIDAAKARPAGTFVIGVDSNQDDIAPGKVLTSMVKHVDIAVFDAAQALKNGKPLTGHVTLGLKEQAIGLTDFKYTSNIVGPEMRNRLTGIQQAIINGRIKPPSTREELATFKPVKM
ncbi:MAG: BMP family ABC transporter substrate-binding protein [Candidatus Eremiobacteraeota bacterium]|nr:BMP family ABC transporter substrate-binding protein [Candidatus Eremiobacteraeota bacterium]